MGDTTSSKHRSNNPYEELIRLHMGVEESEKEFAAETLHHTPGLRDNPAHRQALALLGVRTSQPVAKRSGQRPAMRWRQEEIWPRELGSGLAAVTSAFYAHVYHSSSARSMWFLTPDDVMGSEVARRLSKLEEVVSHIERRVQVLENTERFVDHTVWRSLPPNLVDAGALASNVRKYNDVIAQIFAETFGQPAIVKVSPSDEGDDLPVRILLDASAGDGSALQQRRLEGARARFYDRVANQIPEELVDISNFDFVFPADAAK